MKVVHCTVRGQSRWRFETFTNGKRHRHFFKSEGEARDAMAAIQKDERDIGKGWDFLLARDKSEAMRILDEMKNAGTSLPEVWAHWKATQNLKRSTPCTLKRAVDETLEAKRKANRRETYLKGLELYLDQFSEGRVNDDIGSFTSSKIEAWFSVRNEAPATRRSNLGRLSAMFDLCWRRGYIPENPCWRIEAVSVENGIPKTLTLKQSKDALKWSRKSAKRFLGWLALTLLVGLRPEAEADKISWKEIDLKKKCIRIESAGTKVRSHRIIDLMMCPPALKWLAEAKLIKSPLPLAEVTRRRYLRKLRKKLGFEKWPQDILRHTAASNLLAFHQDAGKVANFLGNSAGTLLRNYKALVYRKDAQKWMRMSVI